MSQAVENGGTGSGGLPRSCINGEGSSGIAAAKALHERSIIAAYFEKYVDHFGFREKISFETGDDYLHALAKERAEGAERSRANGFLPPVQCRPSAVTIAS